MNALIRRRKVARANSLTAWVPQFWAAETLAILNERMFAPTLVHRDFSNQVAQLGDTVNTRRPAEYTAIRKGVNDDVTIQDSSATNVQVVLNQHFHTSILLRDAEMSKGMKQMSAEHMRPAAISINRQIERVIFGQTYQFIGNSVGGIGQMTSNNAKDYALNVRQKLDEQKAWEEGRNFVLNPKTETDFLRPEWFTSADKVGDTMGIRNARIGHKLDFDFYKSLNMPNILTTQTTSTFALTAAAAQGATSIAHATTTTALVTGTWITVDGIPNMVAATGTATATNLRWPLTRAVASATSLVVVTPGALVNLIGGYASGYDGEITIASATAAPKIGQAVSFGVATGNAIYSVINVTGSTGITLDRPLEAAAAKDTVVSFGPAGAYNLAMHKNAIAFVSRPLALPDPESGVKSAVLSDGGLSMRVTMQYQGMKQGMLITFDMLCGIKILDTNLAAVLVA